MKVFICVYIQIYGIYTYLCIYMYIYTHIFVAFASSHHGSIAAASVHWRVLALAAAPWFESRPKVTSRATTSSGWESTTRPELSTDTRSTTPTSTTSTATCTTGRKVTTYEIRLQNNSTWARILLILFHSQL